MKKRTAGQPYTIEVGFVGSAAFDPLNTHLEVLVKGHDLDGSEHVYRVVGKANGVIIPDIGEVAEAVYRFLKDGIVTYEVVDG